MPLSGQRGRISEDGADQCRRIGEIRRASPLLPFEDHLTEQLAGKYAVEDPVALRQGRLIHLWPGVYGPNAAPSRAAFVARLTEFVAPLQEYIRLVQLYLAVTTTSERTRCRAEVAINHHLAAQPAPVGNLLDPAVRYQRMRWEGEEPLEISLSVSSSVRGFPQSLTL